MTISFIILVIVFFAWVFGYRLKAATEDVELKIDPWWASNAYVTLSYRFKGERKWKRLQEYDDFTYIFTPYGEFKDKTFGFRKDGNYDYLKKRFTKEGIEKHNQEILAEYNRTKKFVQKQRKEESTNTSKRI